MDNKNQELEWGLSWLTENGYWFKETGSSIAMYANDGCFTGCALRSAEKEYSDLVGIVNGVAYFNAYKDYMEYVQVADLPLS